MPLTVLGSPPMPKYIVPYCFFFSVLLVDLFSTLCRIFGLFWASRRVEGQLGWDKNVANAVPGMSK